ncbi:MAG: sulfite exporter TauE/SafE family protein [Phycisphaerales bacterium]
MTAMLITVLIASLVGSLHCVGMCGAFVAFAVGTGVSGGNGDGSGVRSKSLLLAAYNGGRLVTYTALGAVAGSLGAALNLGGSYIGIQRTAAALAGAVMIVFGIVTLLRIKGVKLPKAPLPKFLIKTVSVGQGLAMAMRPVPRAITIGLLTTLLPCGWLYAYAAVAAGTASPVYGALTMMAFWLGTLPALVAVGAGIQSLAGVLGKHLPTATAIVIVLVGLFTVMHRLELSSAVYAQAPAVSDGVTPEQSAEQVKQLDAGTLPCCVDGD